MKTDAAQPWYQDGLQFTCTQCGDCCSGAPGYVWVTEPEIAVLAEHLELSVDEFTLMHTRRVGTRVSLREFANGDCALFDGATRRCTVYTARPTQCRTWPFWPSHLESPADWKAVNTVCPGAGCGQLHSLQTIETMRTTSDARL